MRKFRYWFLPLGLSFFSGVIYLYTAPPSMSWEDALNLVDASVTFGVNAPPAPLYVFIAHFFTLLPIGSVIFRMQILSVLLASISLFLLYRIILCIGEQISSNKTEKLQDRNSLYAAIFGVLSLAFSYEFWSQAQNTEKYMLECFIELLVGYLLIVVLPLKKNIFLLLLGIFFLLGLSTGIDPVVISFFPSVIFILWKRRRELDIKKFLLFGVTAIIGITVVYAYLPIMSSRWPFLNWGRPTTLSAIWDVATGQGLNSSTNGLTGSASVFFASIGHFFYMMWVDFTPFILPFVLIGGWYMYKKQKNVFWMLLLIILTNFMLSVLYLSGNQDAWYLLPDISFAMFAGIGVLWLIEKLGSRWYIYLVLVCSLIPLLYCWTGLDRHGWKINDDYAYNLYNPIKEPAILFGGADLFVDNSYYIHDVSGYKSDVIPVLDKNFYINTLYRENLSTTTHIQIPEISKYEPLNPDNYSIFVNDFFAMNMKRYRIYIDYPAFNISYAGVLARSDGHPSLRLDTNRFRLVPAGLSYEVVQRDSTLQPNLQDFIYQFSNGFPEKKPLLEEQVNKDQLNNLIKQYTLSYITVGDYLSQEGKTDEAIAFYQKGYAMDPNNGAILSKLGFYYIQHNQPSEALRYFKQGAQNYPNDPKWLFSIAIANGVLGDTNAAIPLLQQVIADTPNTSQLHAKATNVLTKIKLSVGN